MEAQCKKKHSSPKNFVFFVTRFSDLAFLVGKRHLNPQSKQNQSCCLVFASPFVFVKYPSRGLASPGRMVGHYTAHEVHVYVTTFFLLLSRAKNTTTKVLFIFREYEKNIERLLFRWTCVFFFLLHFCAHISLILCH